jgi:hypothetical protein
VTSAARITEVVARGRWGTVEYAVLASGQMPAREFLENDCERVREKGKNEPQATAHARFLMLFQQMADNGSLAAKRFKSEQGKLFAFSHEVKKVQIRFPCFQDGNRWILTHGFLKPGAKKGLGKWPQSEVERAERTMNEYFRRKSQPDGR